MLPHSHVSFRLIGGHLRLPCLHQVQHNLTTCRGDNHRTLDSGLPPAHAAARQKPSTTYSLTATSHSAWFRATCPSPPAPAPAQVDSLPSPSNAKKQTFIYQPPHAGAPAKYPPCLTMLCTSARPDLGPHGITAFRSDTGFTGNQLPTQTSSLTRNWQFALTSRPTGNQQAASASGPQVTSSPPWPRAPVQTRARRGRTHSAQSHTTSTQTQKNHRNRSPSVPVVCVALA